MTADLAPLNPLAHLCEWPPTSKEVLTDCEELGVVDSATIPETPDGAASTPAPSAHTATVASGGAG